MSIPKIQVAGCLDGFVIEVAWPDGALERAPGVFISEAAAEICASSSDFVTWLKEQSRIRS